MDPLVLLKKNQFENIQILVVDQKVVIFRQILSHKLKFRRCKAGRNYLNSGDQKKAVDLLITQHKVMVTNIASIMLESVSGMRHMQIFEV